MASFDRWRTLAESMHHAELAALVLDESGYTEMWQKDKTPEAPGRLENLKELVSAMEEFDTLAGFLEHISLVMENTTTSQGAHESYGSVGTHFTASKGPIPEPCPKMLRFFV